MIEKLLIALPHNSTNNDGKKKGIRLSPICFIDTLQNYTEISIKRKNKVMTATLTAQFGLRFQEGKNGMKKNTLNNLLFIQHHQIFLTIK